MLTFTYYCFLNFGHKNRKKSKTFKLFAVLYIRLPSEICHCVYLCISTLTHFMYEKSNFNVRSNFNEHLFSLQFYFISQMKTCDFRPLFLAKQSDYDICFI